MGSWPFEGEEWVYFRAGHPCTQITRARKPQWCMNHGPYHLHQCILSPMLLYSCRLCESNCLRHMVLQVTNFSWELELLLRLLSTLDVLGKHHVLRPWLKTVHFEWAQVVFVFFFIRSVCVCVCVCVCARARAALHTLVSWILKVVSDLSQLTFLPCLIWNVSGRS